MIGIEEVVYVTLFLLGCAAIFGLLWYLVIYCEGQFPGVPMFFKVARIFLVVAAIFVLIGLILDLMGHPIIRWR